MQDIRVDDDFFNHPKTVRFHRRTGDHGVTCLFRLWCYASKFFHKGILTGMNAKEIAKAVLWEGDPDEFIDALLTAGGTPNKPGFLDISFDSQSNTQYGLHNWRKRNPYAYFREERSETARMAADIGWERRRKKVKEQHLNAKGNTESNSKRNAPSPSPSPSPSPEKKDLPPTAGVTAGGSETPPAPPKATRSKDACAFIGGCDKRGTIGNNGRWYCHTHNPDNPTTPADLIANAMSNVHPIGGVKK